MRRQTTDPAGYVYLVVHPKYPGWTKIGSAVNPASRLGSYQTGDPDRGYRMPLAIRTGDRRGSEWEAHERLRRLGFLPQGEWFPVAPTFAESIVRKAVAAVDGG